MTEAAETGDLSSRVAAGAAWIMAARFVMRALGFLNTIVLARLLAPDAFGIVAIATAAMQLLVGFTEFGMSQAVIRFRQTGRETLDALFTLSALRGALIAAILLVAAPLAADFYDDPRVLYVFAGMALAPLLGGLTNPAFFEFERDLRFSKEFISSALNKFAGVAVSIAIAVAFKSYIAIVAGVVASAVVQLLLSYALRPYRPRLSLKGAREALAFSGWLFGVAVVTALNNKLDAFILARSAGSSATGIYAVGSQFAELPTTELASPMARALYPGFSALQDDPARAASAFLRGIETAALVALPAAFGFAFIAPDLVPLLLGPQWSGVVSVVQLFTPMMGLHAMLLPIYYYALALGKARLIFFRELAFFFVRLPIFVWATVSYGLQGAVLSAAALGFARFALNLLVYSQTNGRPFWEPVFAPRRSLLATAVMSAFFLLARPSLGFLESLSPVIRILFDVGAGALVYAAALFSLWRLEGAPRGAETAVAELLFARLRRARA